MLPHSAISHETAPNGSKTRTYVPRAGRGGAALGGAAWRGKDGQDGTPTGRFALNTTDPLILQKKTLLGVSLESSNKRISM